MLLQIPRLLLLKIMTRSGNLRPWSVIGSLKDFVIRTLLVLEQQSCSFEKKVLVFQFQGFFQVLHLDPCSP